MEDTELKKNMLLAAVASLLMFTAGFSQEAQWLYVTESTATRFHAKPVATSIRIDSQTIDVCMKASYQKARASGTTLQVALWRFDFKTERFALKEDVGYDENGVVVYRRTVADENLKWQTPSVKSVGKELYLYARSMYESAASPRAL
jgi:hypothetical protein